MSCWYVYQLAHYIVHPIKCKNHVMDCITQTSSREKKLAVISHVCTMQIQVLSSQSLHGGTKVHLWLIGLDKSQKAQESGICRFICTYIAGGLMSDYNLSQTQQGGRKWHRCICVDGITESSLAEDEKLAGKKTMNWNKTYPLDSNLVHSLHSMRASVVSQTPAWFRCVGTCAFTDLLQYFKVWRAEATSLTNACQYQQVFCSYQHSQSL